MKIKTVCEATGLSDRAIRYYIDEELIYPAYTENYLGRRSYDFSDADVRMLRSICMLRNVDFSVAEIRTMIRRPESIAKTMQELIARKKEAAAKETEMIARLERVDPETLSDVSALADALSVSDIAAPDADVKPHDAKRVFRIVRRILAVVYACLPIAAALFGLNLGFHERHYPVIDPLSIVVTVLLLVPSILMLILPFIKKGGRWKRIVSIVLSVLIFLSVIPAVFVSANINSRSETHDYRNYCRFDAEIPHTDPAITYTFFPTKTHFDTIVDGERIVLGEYCYRNLPAWDYTYDIYAEWPVSPEELESEKTRISELFESAASYWNRMQTQHGVYQCMILYEGSEPFYPAKISYTYFIFAYNEETLRVRYILCDSLEQGIDQPYYLELDWNE